MGRPSSRLGIGAAVPPARRSRAGSPRRPVRRNRLRAHHGQRAGLTDRERLAALGFGAGAEDAALALVDGHVVDTRLPALHQPFLVELPQFVAVAAVPLPGGVVRLVLEPHGDAVAVERPQVLAQRVVQFPAPLAAQELYDLRPAGEELVPVPPDRVLGVGPRDPLRVAGVPRVLGGLHLLPGGLLGERRQRRPWAHRILLRERSWSTG